MLLSCGAAQGQLCSPTAPPQGPSSTRPSPAPPPGEGIPVCCTQVLLGRQLHYSPGGSSQNSREIALARPASSLSVQWESQIILEQTQMLKIRQDDGKKNPLHEASSREQ